jgi:hypothetical protein
MVLFNRFPLNQSAMAVRQVVKPASRVASTKSFAKVHPGSGHLNRSMDKKKKIVSLGRTTGG